MFQRPSLWCNPEAQQSAARGAMFRQGILLKSKGHRTVIDEVTLGEVLAGVVGGIAQEPPYPAQRQLRWMSCLSGFDRRQSRQRR